jgi:bisphosphoglycerate-dependent phosphoglycerate mutase
MTTNINSILVTHNARLRCFITKLFHNSTASGDLAMKNHIKDFRWQNGCVLKLVLSNDPSNAKNIRFELSLMYDGEIDPTENKPSYQYWGNNPENPDLTITPKPKGCIGSMCSKPNTVQPLGKRFNHFNTLIGHVSFNDLNDLQMNASISNISNTFTFYLIRHGQAEHNLYTKTTILRKTDTSLTELGKNSAVKSGISINNDLGEKGMINYYFASDLIRTRQTLSSVLKGIQSKHLNFNTRANVIDIIILPCSHELAFVSDGKCDANINMGQPFTNENNMSCTKFNNYNNSQPKQFADCVTFNAITADNVNIVVNINWTFYTAFYGQSYRGDSSKKLYGTKKQCRNTSMIEQSILFIHSTQSQVAGKRNKRKTRRKKQNKRKTKKRK